jgi:NAD(P)-dependent dehydrogenase (short-subunit alcohol dehydrogenase family)
LVSSLGGVGIPIAVDHLHTGQVAALADRIRREHGRIDVLVNDIWGAERLKGGPRDWNTPIWELDLQKGLRILRLGIETHLVTSHYLLPLLITQPGGLLVEVTDGTDEYNAPRYRISVFYDLVKQSVNRLAFSQGHELKQHGATAVAITPGWLRSEMMLDNFGIAESNWRDALSDRGNDQPKAPPDFALSESPRYVGRAVVALATDPDRGQWNKRSLSSGELARHYGFTDIDGSQPDIWRYITEVREGGKRRTRANTGSGSGVMLTVSSAARQMAHLSWWMPKIDRTMSIVAETRQISKRRNSPLNARAKIFNGSGGRCSAVHGKICTWNSACYDHSKPPSGRGNL